MFIEIHIARSPRRRVTDTPGPIWVVGRQHSGNTMLTAMFGRHERVYAFLNEDNFFEQLHKYRNPLSRADIDGIVELVRISQLPPLSPAVCDRVRDQLYSQWQKTPYTDAPRLYNSAKIRLAHEGGALRWTQKATSYVFHAQEVMSALPGSYMIYLIRNPLDIAASLAIRSGSHRWLRMCLGWKQGTRLALQLKKRYPDRFATVRYEDLVTTPRPIVQSLFSFCALPFDESVLGVCHVNPSESPYRLAGPQHGPTTDRVHYFRNHLSKAQAHFVMDAADRSLVHRLYPELTIPASHKIGTHVVSRSRYTTSGLLHMLGDVIARLVRDPRTTVRRFSGRVLRG